MKQTAVEWLLDWMEKNQYFIGNDLLQAVEQALEIEKEQKAYSKKDVIAAMSWAIANYKTNYVEDYFKLLQQNK